MFYKLKTRKYILPLFSKRKKQIILLIIPNGEGSNYLVVKKLSSLLRGITYQNHRFYCFNCLQSFATKSKFESHKSNVKIKIFVML